MSQVKILMLCPHIYSIHYFYEMLTRHLAVVPFPFTNSLFIFCRLSRLQFKFKYAFLYWIRFTYLDNWISCSINTNVFRV